MVANDLDQWLYLFNRGEDFEAYHRFGAHQVGDHWEFLVWAPHAQGVAVVGDWNDWQPAPLSPIGDTGVWRGAAKALAGQHYKFRLTGPDGVTREKIDPFAFAFERKPGTAALLADLPAHDWHDTRWLKDREAFPPYQRPISIYELHLGSFRRHMNDAYLTYAEAAKVVIPYVKKLGFTHIELMPLMEHPLDKSWGYQLMGYFAPTSRFGPPGELLGFIDAAHQAGLGVIMDWVPGHFIRNADALARFDGTPTFEYADAHRADNVRWGSWNFDLGRAQVQSFLLSSATFWLKECHLDGLRVDAVSNMLYMDYDAGKEHDRNRNGGRENLEGIAFLQKLNRVAFSAVVNPLMIAEESSAYPGVTKPVYLGGLGFNYKWNMGWMNDTLAYFSRAPGQRDVHKLTFSFVYLRDEQFILPFSHDEVVHGKKSLMHKMPGDRYNQFANLRVMYVWWLTHPGKKLLFMGSEWGQFLEWRDWTQLEWRDLADPLNAKMQSFTTNLMHLYRRYPALWRGDHDETGMLVTIGDNPDALSYIRRSPGELPVIVVLNLVTKQRDHFRVPVPHGGHYRVILNTEAIAAGGTWTHVPRHYVATAVPANGQADSLDVILPAMGALLIVPEPAEG